MLDSDESGVTYTDISSPFEELSDIGSPRADDHEHLMLPEMLEDLYVEVASQAPPSPDYIPGPEEPEQAPPSPDYVPGLEHVDDEISPEYVPESDFEAYPEDDDDEDPEEDPVDYLADGGDDGDDEEESSEDDEDDDMDIEADEEEEHPAPADPIVLPSASRREDRPEVTLPPQKRLGIALGPRYEVGESSYAAAARPAGGLKEDYGFVATMDRKIMRDPEREHMTGNISYLSDYEPYDGGYVSFGQGGGKITGKGIIKIVETLQGAPVSTDTELGGYVREFETRVRQDTDEIYMRLDDEQTERQLLAGRLNMLFRDRRAHAYTRHLMETEARMSREAWVRATNASDLVHGEVMSLLTTVLDHRRYTEISELRTALQGQVTALQGQVTALQAQVTTLQGQQGLAEGPTQTKLPEEAGGSA
nr:hypothetical protein [Tanacetum cinerariifolium]